MDRLCGDRYTYLNMLKTFELYTLNEQIVWYMNYILRKLLNIIDLSSPIVLRILIMPDSHHLLSLTCAKGFVGIIYLSP